MRTLKKARFIIFYYLTDQVDVKKNENLLKQEITNLAIFSSFQKLSFKHLKNEIRQNQGICHNGAFVV